MAAAVAVALLGGGYMVFSSGGSSTNAAVEGTSDADPGMIVGGGGWTTTWGSDSPNNKGKQISIYRPSMPMSDYRFEFRGQIEKKALGWLFRASNPKNYYVMKLEAIKGGANPLVALIKYAVIDGKEQTHTQVMLPFDVKVGTLYHVRMDVGGDKFATYVQDKLVDHWNDDRIKRRRRRILHGDWRTVADQILTSFLFEVVLRRLPQDRKECLYARERRSMVMVR